MKLERNFGFRERQVGMEGTKESGSRSTGQNNKRQVVILMTSRVFQQ